MGEGYLSESGSDAKTAVPVDRRANFKAFEALETFYTDEIRTAHSKVLALTDEIDHMKAEGFAYAEIFAQQEVRRAVQEQLAELKRQRTKSRDRLVY
ncbi:MAG: hypothetical protein AAGM84_03235 [Pseudomonadota bacterium]